MRISNPVLSGFNPDPSIIRVEDTYYIATSTFEWFPGVQIHESKDLVNWHLITHPLDTVEFVDMAGNPDSGGVWAPDLSYADGRYWLVFSDVKIVDGPYKDVHNYLITAEDIRGPWSKPIELNGVGFDASLFHDDDGRKYLVQQTWDHREYLQPFHGISLTELDLKTMKLMPQTARTIYEGTDIRLLEGPHIYKIDRLYYLFAAQGGTTYTHQEVVSRSRSLDALSFETQPGEVFLTNFDTPRSYLQKQGHGSLVATPRGEWYYASLASRPWNRPQESSIDPRGWNPLGRETAIQKVQWDSDGWPHIIGGHGGQRYVEAPQGVEEHRWPRTYLEKDDFDEPALNINFNTLRIPFSDELGSLTERPGFLRLFGREALNSRFTQAHVARRWQSFNFDAEIKLAFNPWSYQQAAGLTSYYNTRHYSMIEVTWDEKRETRVIEIIENNRNHLRSYLKDAAIEIPDDIEFVYLKVKVRRQTYSYAYSFDGSTWIDIPVTLDAAILSDDYVLQTMGGFFTGAFTGMAAVDYGGYRIPADFDYFRYTELDTEE
ncbi:Xylan 1,4-beta-xylosidase [Coriobacterium glomerans PW2]|uniref:Xylan 1,4-beta-xylosidase n=1 Tax=Coriobacterium glomerans (strain ATCC 49209 / DSM 20642 / JCM 10262 / PW2) TaxID=700015 RepID=F2NBD9_CORGP|nr:glycoside hydrolase family 43 protein [Coriobacterium glomerans]AEB06675.1 Xylan 1,4-beta-xylosidase [Coriobacterium glomerans PW2]